MRHKRLILSALLLLGLGLTGLQAQIMYVKESSGTQTVYALSNIRKMSFSTGNLTITKTDNSSEVYALNGLRYLNFRDISANLAEQLPIQGQRVIAYPNPANNVLNIDLSEAADPKGTISIINLEGKTIIRQQVTYKGVILIDISHLPKGIYICRYSNIAESKTVKISKQ